MPPQPVLQLAAQRLEQNLVPQSATALSRRVGDIVFDNKVLLRLKLS